MENLKLKEVENILSTKEELDELKNSIISGESKENLQQGPETISDSMFQELLSMEGTQSFVAKPAPHLGEDWATGPYGMVYKWIDKNGNLLKNPVQFRKGEKVPESRAKDNAKACYNSKAKDWSNALKEKGFSFTQENLDALVCQSNGTKKSRDKLKKYVLNNWNNKENIVNYLSTFATKAAKTGKRLPGLVKRAKFASNWFKGVKNPYNSY